MALRKELEEKRRKEGKSQEPKLTPKQKELLDQQLDKESLIRQRVSSIKATVYGLESSRIAFGILIIMGIVLGGSCYTDSICCLRGKSFFVCKSGWRRSTS